MGHGPWSGLLTPPYSALGRGLATKPAGSFLGEAPGDLRLPAERSLSPPRSGDAGSQAGGCAAQGKALGARMPWGLIPRREVERRSEAF